MQGVNVITAPNFADALHGAANHYRLLRPVSEFIPEPLPFPELLLKLLQFCGRNSASLLVSQDAKRIIFEVKHRQFAIGWSPDQAEISTHPKYIQCVSIEGAGYSKIYPDFRTGLDEMRGLYCGFTRILRNISPDATDSESLVIYRLFAKAAEFDPKVSFDVAFIQGEMVLVGKFGNWVCGWTPIDREEDARSFFFRARNQLVASSAAAPPFEAAGFRYVPPTSRL